MAETRRLDEIAREIIAHWPNVHYSAVPYLRALTQLGTMDDRYGHDSASSIVAYFLGNAKTWRGEAARRIKKELNAMLKRAR
jgi:hypothetical protein